MEEMKVEKSEPQKLETENQEKLVRKKREEIEQQLLDLPIVQYAWLSERTFHFRIMYVKSAGRNARVTGRAGPVRRESEP